MNASLTASCPKCQTVLRIPAEWAGKSVRCQACRAVVKVNGPAPMTMVYDPATGAYVPAPYQPAGPANDFADLEAKRTGKKRKYKRGGGGGAAVAVGLLVLLIGAGIAAVVLTDNPVKARLLAALNGDRTPTTESAAPPTPPPAAATGPLPRRMLAVSITKYLYCNPLTGGKSRNGSSEFYEAVKALAFRWDIPDAKDNNQLFVLTDADGKLPPTAAHRPMLKPLVADAVAQFCATSRPQDRVVLYFGGHAVAKDGKAYLVPTDGDLNEPDTLLPLEEVWAKLKACPAQQKVVLFDVCRLSSDDNAVRPGSEPMTEELEKLLHSPPDGVEVVTSCSAGQTAAEFRTAADADTPQGSAFLGALRVAARKAKSSKPNPADPLPVAAWVEGAQARLADLLGKERPSTVKASGSPGPAVEAKAEEPAKRFEFAAPPKGADLKDVKAVFALLDTPPLLGPPPPEADAADAVVVFPEQAMKEFAPDGSVDEVLAAAKPLNDRIIDISKAQWDALKHPTRVAAVKALQQVRTRWSALADPKADSVLFDGLSGKANDELKKRIEKQQIPISELILDLEETANKLTELQEQAGKDESKFWRATFRYALAQVKLRWAFASEAILLTGNIRTDSLPDGVDRGLRLVQVPKMKSKKEVSAAGKEAVALLDELAKEAKGTPWEVEAKQWRGVSLGLEWRAKKADADTTAAEEKK
jgi:hypothetical protein